MSLTKEVRRKRTLDNAWRVVKERGSQSKSTQVKRELREFDQESHIRLNRIEKRLRQGVYRFQRLKGIPLERLRKEDRPVVMATVCDRIVQRAILDVLQDQTAVRRFIEVPTSFGALPSPHGGVRPALETAVARIREGYACYLKTDIVDFYANVPRRRALRSLLGDWADPEFAAFVDEATTVELENAAELGGKRRLFPDAELGLGQGLSLSPLLGNALLYDFDQALNGRGVICLRYVDDLLLLATRSRHLTAAFRSAQEYLKPLGLDLYQPGESEKAKIGEISKGLSYLGCEVRSDSIRPSKENQRSLIHRARGALENGLAAQRDLKTIRRDKLSFREVLEGVSHLLEGWGNQYAFCNCSSLLLQLDKEIDDLLDNFYRSSGIEIAVSSSEARRVLMGVHRLVDSKTFPIVQQQARAA